MRRFLVVATCSASLLLARLALGASAGANGWDPVGDGGTPGTASLNGAVTALRADGADLYAGGLFTDAGGVASADAIAKWNGAAWSAFAPLDGAVYAIAVAGGKLYVGGAFTNAGGNPNADFLAGWNGSAWAPVCNATGPAFGGSVYALQVIDGTLYVGGAFQNGAGIPSADYLLACDLNTGDAATTMASDGGMNGPVYALAADDLGTLYVGGSAINMDGKAAIDYVGAFDGSWHALGTGPGAGGGAIDAVVRALASDGTSVYVGTDALAIAGIPGADHVARWDGAWHAMGPNYFSTPTSIYALAVSGPLVFAGGSFQNANGDPLADAIVAWDGAAWHPLGSNGAGNGPLAGNANALATMGARVFAGGGFSSAGGDALARFAAQAAISQGVFANGFE